MVGLDHSSEKKTHGGCDPGFVNLNKWMIKRKIPKEFIVQITVLEENQGIRDDHNDTLVLFFGTVHSQGREIKRRMDSCSRSITAQTDVLKEAMIHDVFPALIAITWWSAGPVLVKDS